MRMLIWGFAGRTYNIVGDLKPRLNCILIICMLGKLFMLMFLYAGFFKTFYKKIFQHYQCVRACVCVRVCVRACVELWTIFSS